MYRFGEKLKEIRKEKNISQQKLAELLGVSFVAVSQWELGKRSPKSRTVRHVADALGVSVAELVDFFPLEKSVVSFAEEQLPKLEERLDRTEQADVSEAPGEMRSYEEDINEVHESCEFLEKLIDYAISHAMSKPRAVRRGMECDRIAVEKEAAGGKRAEYPDELGRILRKLSRFMEKEDMPQEQIKLWQGLVPALYETMLFAARTADERKADGAEALLDLYGQLDSQGKRTAVAWLGELARRRADAKPPEDTERN